MSDPTIFTEPVTIAVIGLAGAVIGSVATVAGNIAIHFAKERSEAKKDKPAKALLTELLNHNEHTWRNLATLAHVIGANEEKTKQLLLEIGARASEDGKALWALKSKAPLNSGNK